MYGHINQLRLLQPRNTPAPAAAAAVAADASLFSSLRRRQARTEQRMTGSGRRGARDRETLRRKAARERVKARKAKIRSSERKVKKTFHRLSPSRLSLSSSLVFSRSSLSPRHQERSSSSSRNGKRMLPSTQLRASDLTDGEKGRETSPRVQGKWRLINSRDGERKREQEPEQSKEP